jgi:hypothetical protein
MFLYWAGLFSIPRIFISDRIKFEPGKKQIIKFYLIYSILHLVFSLIAPRDINALFVPIIWTIAYLILVLKYILPLILRRN